MRIFADLHHFDLFHSFQLLFEGRLGHELHRPIGFDWANKGFWSLSALNDPVATAYLSTESGQAQRVLKPFWHNRPAEWARFALEMLRIGPISYRENDLYYVRDLSKPGVFQKAVTLDRFKGEKYDAIISSVPQHWELFEKLRKQYQPQARHIFHMGPGNVKWKVPEDCKNLMHHGSPLDIAELHQVSYCQEFSLDTFRPQPNHKPKDIIRSYVHWPKSEELWNNLHIPWQFEFVGKTLGSLDDTIIETEALAESIRNSKFVWHFKPGGESYGHILHNSYAIGRPVIINMQDYKGTRGGDLLEDMVTCVDLTGCKPTTLREKILEAAKPSHYNRMCEAAHLRFKQVVDFSQEETLLKQFMENLQ